MQAMKAMASAAAVVLLLGACGRETKDERFRREFQTFTEKECPKPVDPYTVEDSAVYDIGSRTLCCYYTVEGDLDNVELYTEDAVSDVRDIMLKNLKSSIQMKPYKDEGISFRHDYRSKQTGETLVLLHFTPEDYGK